MSETAPYMKIRTSERSDGSKWRTYETPNSIFVLTGVGRSLILEDGLYTKLQAYSQDLIENDTDTQEPKTRNFLAAGGNAKVFSVGDTQLAIKEARMSTDELSPDQLLPALERMDRLVYAIEKNCPRWIDIPQHYGVLIPKKNPLQQFMLMQKIDSGITVTDILSAGSKNERTEHYLNPSSLVSFGPIDSTTKSEIKKLYEEMLVKVRNSLMLEYMSPDEYLPDIKNQDNVLVERLQNPIAGKMFKLWIIDQ
jgi:hypothetical protein